MPLVLDEMEGLRRNEVLQGLQVLVADPNPDNCELLSQVLEPYQMQVHTAHSVPQALSVWRQVLPDLVVIELVLPGEDGYALLHQIRQLELVQGSKAIAVAVTGDMLQSEVRTSAAGFAKLLWKPVDVSELGTLLAELIVEEEGEAYGCRG